MSEMQPSQPSQPSGGVRRPSEALQAEWDKKINMKREVEMGPEASPGMKEVISAIQIHYITTSGHYYDAHRAMLARAKEIAASAEALPEERESLDEDFMRSIEEEVVQVEITTRLLWDALLKKKPWLAKRPDSASIQMRPLVNKSFPEFTEDLIDVLISKTMPHELR